MDAIKFWTAIIIISLIAGTVTFFNYLQGIDEANAALLDVRARVKQLEETVKLRQVEADAMVALQAKVQAAMAQTTPLQERKNELQKKIRAHEAELKFLDTSIRAAVEKVRASMTAPSSPSIPQIILPLKKVLMDARPRKIELTEVSFGHSDGATTVPADQLPTELRQKLDVGSDALVPRMEETISSLLGKGK